MTPGHVAARSFRIGLQQQWRDKVAAAHCNHMLTKPDTKAGEKSNANVR